MPILDARDIGREKARTLFDVALGQLLFFADGTQAVGEGQGPIIDGAAILCLASVL